MPKNKNLFISFLSFLILSLFIFFLSKTGVLNPLSSFFDTILSPVQKLTYSAFSNLTNSSSSPEILRLKQENLLLTQKLIDQQKLISDNKALNDQFQTQNPKSSTLLPSNVVGAPSFIPGVSVPETLILDKGSDDRVRIGDAVVYKNNLIGKIAKVSNNFSTVLLITNSGASFTAETLLTKTPGIIKGQGGGEVIFDNVLLSDKLNKDDLVVTKGDINQQGNGFLPGLVVGKIISVSKNPSDLFQKAEVQSEVNFAKIDKVFISTNL